MDLIYTAMSGAKHAQASMQIVANNLANVNSNGFRADMENASAFLIDGPGYQTKVFAQSANAGTDFNHGSLQTTGRDLDIAIQGDGFISVQGENGGVGYTRAGNMQLDVDGNVSINGKAVIADGAQLNLPPFQSIEIGKDGTVSIVPEGGGALIEAGRIELVKPDYAGMRKGLDGLFYQKNGQRAEASDEVTLVSGFLESSNVNAVSELVSSMTVNRAFEMQVKLMKTADNLAQVGNKLVGG